MHFAFVNQPPLGENGDPTWSAIPVVAGTMSRKHVILQNAACRQQYKSHHRESVAPQKSLPVSHFFPTAFDSLLSDPLCWYRVMSAEPQSVAADLLYFSPPKDGSKPYADINADPTTGQHRANWEPVAHTVQIENLRGKEDSVTLGAAGFQYGREAATHKAFTSDAAIEAEYYPESIELVKRITGASRIVPFDHSASA